MKARIGLLALMLAVGLTSPAFARRHMLTYSCNTDGTYTCGDSCLVAPYYGKIGCCEKPGPLI
jgi:hypothetical protein